ncbi:hypothetical protein F4777DRAFT_377221 [Nemania sp. FL0916]|nr:hypothetical protein F4777DRAFT_377221 [Nemania sp. FL0916]
MAKSRRNRAKAGQRADPLAKPVKPPSDPELAAIREKSILPVLKDLQSPDPKNRTSAAAAISNIVENSKCRKLLLREQIVHILLTETLTDASLESRAAGWEILCVLAEKEEADFSVHLYRLDIFTAVQHASAKITEALVSPDPAFNKMSKAEQKFLLSIAEALCNIIVRLILAQDEAVNTASQNPRILRFLSTLISTDYIEKSVIEAALCCMVTLSEDNRQFAEAVLSDGADQCYKRLMAHRHGDSLIKAFACAVLHNIFHVMDWNDQNLGIDGACDAVLVPALVSILSLNLGHLNHDDDALEGDGSAVSVALETLAQIGTTLQNSLGKGSRAKTNTQEGPGDKGDVMDADGDDELSDRDDRPVDEDDEMDEDELEADMEMVTAADHDADDPSGIDDLPTLKALIHNIIPLAVKLFRNIQGETEETEFLIQLRTKTLAAISNIAWTVSCIDFSDDANAAILQAWTPVARLIWSDTIAPVLASNTSDVSLATMVTSLAWAVARTLHKESFLSGDEHKKFISLYHASKNLDSDPEDPFQSLGVKCIGVLGQLALDPAPVALNREIGVFLVTVVAGLPETPAAESVEALNQLFDIYGDEDSANDKEVFGKDNFLQHIEGAVPKVKAMAKAVDKRKSAELRARAEEASLNLPRFIQYKQKHKP